MNSKTRTFSTSLKLWLFAVVFPLHIAEETRGVGATHGINLSLRHFFLFTGLSWLGLIVSIILAKKFGFPQFFLSILGTLVLANGLSHLIHSFVIGGPDAGVVTGTILFLPLGVWALTGAMKTMGWLRYSIALLLGLTTQVMISLIAGSY